MINIYSLPQDYDVHKILGLEGKLPHHLAMVTLVTVNAMVTLVTVNGLAGKRTPSQTASIYSGTGATTVSFSYSAEQGKPNFSEKYFKHFLLASLLGKVSR